MNVEIRYFENGKLQRKRKEMDNIPRVGDTMVVDGSWSKREVDEIIWVFNSDLVVICLSKIKED